LTTGRLRSDARYGNNGAFIVPGPEMQKLFCIASDYEAWEHVSISLVSKKRIPTWTEMCHVKDLFWQEEETVIQYHPPKSEYVNCHPATLHLWRPIGMEIVRPPHTLVGPKDASETLALTKQLHKLHPR
jgi:hypothetical protein